MSTPRGDSAVTRQAILAAARELFAAHGVDGVSVRQIAAKAGVNHALVHRYFGAKDEMVAAILIAEGERMGAMGRPEAGMEDSLAALREVLLHALTAGSTSLHLMLRAEMDGRAPEQLLEQAPMRPLALLRAWIERRAPAAARVDPEALAVVVGAAMMGLVSCRPMLAAGAGAAEVADDELLGRCVDVLVGLVAAAVGAEPGTPDAGPSSVTGEGS